MSLEKFYQIAIFLSFFGVLMTSLESQKTTPLVSILIINYNTAEVTIKSIENIIANTDYQPYEIIIIDNDSQRDDQNMLVEYAEQKSLTYYLMDDNIGWNDGVNYGFSKASGSLLLTINSDVIVEKGWLKNMVNIYFSQDKVGAVNANIHEEGESIISANCGELKILHGACCIFSEKAWHLVGKLDSKNFKFYGTENDWSYRARSIGYKLLLSESSVVNHLGSSKITSGGGLSVKKTGKIIQFIKIRLEGRVKFRAYNYELKDWLSREILSEFKHAYINGYFSILIATYIRVLFNIKNIFLARKQRSLKRKEALKILAYDENKQP